MERKSSLLPKLILAAVLLLVAAALLVIFLSGEKQPKMSEQPELQQQEQPLSTPIVEERDKQSLFIQQLEKALVRKDFKAARETLEDLRNEYPEYEHLPSFFYQVAMCEREGGIDANTVEKNLKEIAQTYPNTVAAMNSLTCMTEIFLAQNKGIPEMEAYYKTLRDSLPNTVVVNQGIAGAEQDFIEKNPDYFRNIEMEDVEKLLVFLDRKHRESRLIPWVKFQMLCKDNSPDMKMRVSGFEKLVHEYPDNNIANLAIDEIAKLKIASNADQTALKRYLTSIARKYAYADISFYIKTKMSEIDKEYPETITTILASDPDNPYYRELLKKAVKHIGESNGRKEVVSYLKHLIKTFPDDEAGVAAIEDFTELFLADKKPRLARIVCFQIMKRFPETKVGAAAFHTLPDVYYASGDYLKVIAFISQYGSQQDIPTAQDIEANDEQEIPVDNFTIPYCRDAINVFTEKTARKFIEPLLFYKACGDYLHSAGSNEQALSFYREVAVISSGAIDKPAEDMSAENEIGYWQKNLPQAIAEERVKLLRSNMNQKDVALAALRKYPALVNDALLYMKEATRKPDELKAAVDALMEYYLENEDKSVLDGLINLSNSKDKTTRLTALSGFGRIPHLKCANQLFLLLDDPDGDVRYAAFCTINDQLAGLDNDNLTMLTLMKQVGNADAILSENDPFYEKIASCSAEEKLKLLANITPIIQSLTSESEYKIIVDSPFGPIGEQQVVGILYYLKKDEDVAVRKKVNNYVAVIGAYIKPDEIWGDKLMILSQDRIQNFSLSQASLQKLSPKIFSFLQLAESAIAESDFAAAEESYAKARGMAPNCKQVLYDLGKFYCYVKDQNEGFSFLNKHGLGIAVEKQTQPPTIDGKLEKVFWEKAAKLPLGYKRTPSFDAAEPKAQGKTEISLSYTDDALYIACVGSESPTTPLVARHSNPDDPLWKDDSFEILLDTNLDGHSFYQIVINSKGAVFDCYYEEAEKPKINWDSRAEVKSNVENGIWRLEIKLPFEQLGSGAPSDETMWGLDLCRIRRCAENEYCSWYPVFGDFNPNTFGLLMFKEKEN